MTAQITPPKTLAQRLDELKIELHVEALPNGEYRAYDGNRYDGPGSPYCCLGSKAHEAVEQLIQEIVIRAAIGGEAQS